MIRQAARQIGKLPAGVAEVPRRRPGIVRECSLAALGEFIGTGECLGREAGLDGLLALEEESLAERLGIRRSRSRLSLNGGDDGVSQATMSARSKPLRSANVMTGLGAGSDDYVSIRRELARREPTSRDADGCYSDVDPSDRRQVMP